ncbi:Pectinesterase, catalytic [Sesbania bispinosa]|nr:Pectinesterase, catalytic [Sesbania bispinosa]
MGKVESGATFLASLTLLLLLTLPSARTILDQQLADAIVRVRKDGRGDFTTVTEAVNSIPSGNKRRVVIWIGIGEYREKIRVDRSKPFVTFYGEKNGNDIPVITYDATALQYGTVDSATVTVESDYFVAVNVAFVVGATVYYGEYRCMGPGATSSGRVKFQKLLSYEEAKPFLSMAYIHGQNWVLPPPNL